jgi:hypothetical protein
MACGSLLRHQSFFGNHHHRHRLPRLFLPSFHSLTGICGRLVASWMIAATWSEILLRKLWFVFTQKINGVQIWCHRTIRSCPVRRFVRLEWAAVRTKLIIATTRLH